mmetsp:Transcript_40954/g.78219  ORF Transcript_40954/g.78219 Transcript_40954/m.78219 type:complete len:161 (-) Transcript_40954:1474-1956(-)
MSNLCYHVSNIVLSEHCSTQVVLSAVLILTQCLLQMMAHHIWLWMSPAQWSQVVELQTRWERLASSMTSLGVCCLRACLESHLLHTCWTMCLGDVPSRAGVPSLLSFLAFQAASGLLLRHQERASFPLSHPLQVPPLWVEWFYQILLALLLDESVLGKVP